MRKELRYTILFVLVLIQFWRNYKNLPKMMSLFLTVIASSITLTALCFSYAFYGSLPETRKTALTYWMRHFLFVFAISVLWIALASVILEFPDFLVPWFKSYPQITCTLLQGETTFSFILFSVFHILALSIFLKVNTYGFVTMNHELFYLVTSILWTVVTALHVIIPLLKYGTICTRGKVTRMIHVNGVKIEFDSVKTYKSAIIQLIDCAILFLPLISKWLYQLYLKFTTIEGQRQIQMSEPPKVSLHNQNVLVKGSNNVEQISSVEHSQFNLENEMKLETGVYINPMVNNWVEPNVSNNMLRSWSADESILRFNFSDNDSPIFTIGSQALLLNNEQSQSKEVTSPTNCEVKELEGLNSKAEIAKNLVREPIYNIKTYKNIKVGSLTSTPSSSVDPEIEISVEQLDLDIASINSNPSNTVTPLSSTSILSEIRKNRSSIKFDMTFYIRVLFYGTAITFTFFSVYNSFFAFSIQFLLDLVCYVVPVKYFLNNVAIIEYTERKLFNFYKKNFNKS